MAASAFAVESANTVGYTTMAAEQGKFIIMGVQLDEVAANGARDLNALVSGVQGVNYDDNSAFTRTAAQVQIPNAIGAYDTYYFLNDGWYKDTNNQDAYKPGWCDAYGVLVNADLTPGVAMWVKSVPGNANVNVAGEVPTDATTVVSCPASFALRADAYPIAVMVNGEGMATANAANISYDDNSGFTRTATQIQIPNAIGAYDTYYFLNDGWYKDTNNQDAYKPGWCDAYGVLVDATIPVAQGFWTKGVSGTFTLTFSK